MSFRNFMKLYEGEYVNKATLIFQAFLDNMENAHYNKDENMLTFNLGKAAKLAKFADLEVVIRKTGQKSVRLAKRKTTDKFAIVIDLDKLPDITELDEKLESKEIMTPAVEAIESYLDVKRKHPSSNNDYKTDYEKTKHYNEKSVFEEYYQKLVSRLREKYQELEKMIDNFEQQKEKTGNSSRKVTLDMAIDKLKGNYLGKNAKEFMSKAYKELEEIDPNFKENLDKDKKKLLEDRLKQFYEDLA